MYVRKMTVPGVVIESVGVLETNLSRILLRLLVVVPGEVILSSELLTITSLIVSRRLVCVELRVEVAIEVLS